MTLALERSVAETERLRGSVVVGMDDPAYHELLPPGAERRLFTQNLLGCTGIGYVALRADGSRELYFRHAYSMDVVRKRIVVPHVGRTVVSVRAVIMAKSSVTTDEALRPYPAADIASRSGALYTGPGVQHIVGQMSEHIDPADITVVPYRHDRVPAHPYSNTFALDVPGAGMGMFFAEDKPIG